MLLFQYLSEILRGFLQEFQQESQFLKEFYVGFTQELLFIFLQEWGTGNFFLQEFSKDFCSEIFPEI